RLSLSKDRQSHSRRATRGSCRSALSTSIASSASFQRWKRHRLRPRCTGGTSSTRSREQVGAAKLYTNSSGEYASRTLSIENQRDAAIPRRDNHELIFRDDKAEVTQFRHLITDRRRELIELDAGWNFSPQGQPQPHLREVRWDAVEHKRSL